MAGRSVKPARKLNRWLQARSYTRRCPAVCDTAAKAATHRTKAWAVKREHRKATPLSKLLHDQPPAERAATKGMQQNDASVAAVRMPRLLALQGAGRRMQAATWLQQRPRSPLTP